MADKKVTELTELTSLSAADLLYVVDDPSGTALSKKMTLQTLLDFIGGGAPSTNDFRLSLVSGNPLYTPIAATPNATDTTAETVSFAAAHGWATGTLASVSATGGGLTAGTVYYLRAVSSTSVSFHTTLADAEAGTNLVNLNASITAEIQPYGVSSTSVKLTLFKGNRIGLYTGSTWAIVEVAELTLALGTLVADTNYDVFLDYNGGSPQLILGAAWTNATTRSEAITTQNGIWVKSGALDHRYLGTIRTDTTTSTIDSLGGVIDNVGAKRFLYNADNQRRRRVACVDNAASYNYTSTTVRQQNGNAGSRVEVVDGLGDILLDLIAGSNLSNSSAGHGGSIGFGVDTTTVFEALRANVVYIQAPAAGQGNRKNAHFHGSVGIGYHAINWLQNGSNSGTTSWSNLSTLGAAFSLKCGLFGTTNN